MDNSSAYTVLAIAVVGVLATCVGALVWVIKFLFQKLLPAFDQQNKVTSKLVNATSANTKATKAADAYLRERNGRDNDFQKYNIKAIEAIPAKMQEIADKQAKALIHSQNIHDQYVESQKVDMQQVGKTIIKKEKKRT